MSSLPSEPRSRLPGDEELLLAAGRGDLGAFEHLMLRYEHAAWNAAYRFLGDPVEAEDIAQEAFFRIYRAAARYQPTATFRTYLYRIVTRLCIDFVEKKRPYYSSNLPDGADQAPIPHNVVTITDRCQEVRKALDRLPPTQRMAVVLKYYEGLGYREISEAMETTVKGVERLLARGREALGRSLLTIFD